MRVASCSTDLYYERREPENTILYQVIRKYWVSTLYKMEASYIESGHLSFCGFPYYIRREFSQFLECGILANGFLRLLCPHCGSNKLVAHLCKGRGTFSQNGSDRSALEELCRYVARPALLSNSRISEDNDGNIIFALKNHYTDGTTHLKFTPEEFIEKLVALIPPSRAHLVRCHGLLAPNSKKRSEVVPKKKEKAERKKKKVYWIQWSELLKRVFKKDALICNQCGHSMKILASVTDPDVIKKILQAMNLWAESSHKQESNFRKIEYIPSD
ncbi:MAG: transposase [Oligoflexia bacterium]|nr:transposase [Oligoflexia bacterium]